jgi:undecaprenyl-diphosphatase
MNWSSVLILAVVQGLTEFLPVSSTGHMILVSNFLHFEQTDFLDTFQIVVQVGAILAVLSKYWSVLLKRRDYWLLMTAAFIPTTIIGYLGYSTVKSFFLGNVTVTMVGLLLGGVILLVIEKWFSSTKSLDSLSIKNAVFIGLLQAIAIIPGVSRSASTIIGGQVVGLSRKAAVEFSFLLGMPVLMAAAGFELLQTSVVFSAEQWGQITVGILVSFVVARLSVDWLLSFVEKNSLAIFGWYRIAISLVYFTNQWVGGR